MLFHTKCKQPKTLLFKNKNFKRQKKLSQNHSIFSWTLIAYLWIECQMERRLFRKLGFTDFFLWTPVFKDKNRKEEILS